MSHSRSGRLRTRAVWAGLPALLGACAALALPDVSSTAGAEAAMLAVGALALLAGHTWGLLVAVSSHVPLVGRVWPALAEAQSSTTTAAAVAVVVATAVPIIVLAAALFPRLVAHALPGASPRGHAAATLLLAVALGASLILPAVA